MNPQVLETSPKNYETNVFTNTPLTAEFNTDLFIKDSYLDTFVYLTDSNGVRIDGRIVYRKRKLTFTPLKTLDPGSEYRFFLIGKADVTNGTNGIKSILEEPMLGNVIVTFTTEGQLAIDPPQLQTPADGVLLRQPPTFSWKAATDAAKYEVRISQSNRFETTEFKSETAELMIDPDVEWPEGIHYWSVRSIRNDGVASEWSITRQFNLTTLVEGKISEEDAPPVEVIYEEASFELELIETFPSDTLADVPINVKSIYFRVIGDVNVEMIDVESFSIVGKHITGDPTEDSHGDVKGTYAIVSDKDGTTYIVFTPEVLPADTEGA